MIHSLGTLRWESPNVDAWRRFGTEILGMMAVQGPKSVELVKGMFADDVTALTYYFAMPTAYKGQTCLVSRTVYTAEDGFVVWCSPDLGVG